MPTRLDSGIERSHWALGFRELLGKFDLELCARLVRNRRDLGDDVARHQPQDEPVRVLQNNCVVDRQVKRGGGRRGRSDRTRNL